MAKVRIRGIKNQKKLLRARAKRLGRIALTDQRLVNRFKNEIINPIRKDGILPDGSKVKGVKKSWVLQRTRLSKFNKVDKYYKRFFSNLTFTGQFLRSFRGKIFKGKKVSYLIAPTGFHRIYKTSAENRRGKRKKKISNAELGGYLIEQGRDYTRLGKKMKRKLSKIALGRIRREFKLNLNR